MMTAETEEAAENSAVQWKPILLEQMRCCVDLDPTCCPLLAEVLSRIPAEFPLPSDSDVRLFHLAIRDNYLSLIGRLLVQFPTLVLHHHFGESPLMAAVRCGFEELAIYLVEHGADVHCSKLLFVSGSVRGTGFDWYEVSARELAYEKRMLELLEIIDYLSGNYFPYLPAPRIAVRMLRPVNSAEFDITRDFVDIPSDFFTNDFLKPGDPKPPPAKKSVKKAAAKSSPKRRAAPVTAGSSPSVQKRKT